MEFRQLIYFVAAAETGSFSQASRRCHITQSAISQQIKQLEEELKTELFVRSTPKLTLTYSGKEFLVSAKDILYDIDKTLDHFRKIDKLQDGQLNIGIGSFIEPYIRRATAKMIELHPNIRLNLVYAQPHMLNKMLLEHEVDMAFTMNMAYEDEDIESSPAIPFHLSAVLRRNHPLAGKEKLTFDDVIKQRVIMPTAGQRSWDSILRYAPVPFDKFRPAVICNDPDACRNLVQETNMITFLPCMYVDSYPNLLAKPIVGLEMLMNSNVHWLKGVHHSEAARAFLKIVKEYSVPYCSTLL